MFIESFNVTKAKRLKQQNYDPLIHNYGLTAANKAIIDAQLSK